MFAVSFQAMYREFDQFNVALLLVVSNKVLFLYKVIDLEMRDSNLPCELDVWSLRGSDSSSARSR
jgi:hypothetical protein